MMLSSGFFKFSPELRDLSLLEELEKNPEISQRMLAQKLGVALGVINSSLRTMGAKGWIRTGRFDHRRQSYFLTPEGTVEKARLSAQLASWRLLHYGALKETVARTLRDMESEGVERVVFYGVSPEMEIAYISIQGTSLKLVGIVEDDEIWRSQIIFGYELEPVSRVRDLRPDGILITSLTETDRKRRALGDFEEDKSIHLKEICFP